jgi:hypothetical protein
MLILPFGHDKTVHGRQWITWLLITVNVLVFAMPTMMDRGAAERVRSAVDLLDTAQERRP